MCKQKRPNVSTYRFVRIEGIQVWIHRHQIEENKRQLASCVLVRFWISIKLSLWIERLKVTTRATCIDSMTTWKSLASAGNPAQTSSRRWRKEIKACYALPSNRNTQNVLEWSPLEKSVNLHSSGMKFIVRCSRHLQKRNPCSRVETGSFKDSDVWKLYALRRDEKRAADNSRFKSPSKHLSEHISQETRIVCIERISTNRRCKSV